jgi:hypothetical protein
MNRTFITNGNQTYTPPDTAVDNLGLAKIQNGKAPQWRIKDAKRAQELGHKLLEDASERSRKNALLLGLIQGNKPFNTAKLRAAAQAWRTNVNWRETKATISAALTPFYDLFTGSKFFFEITTDFGGNLKEKYDYSVAITEEADYMLREWEGFDFHMQAMLFDFVAFGKGFLYWLDPTDWRFEWLAQHLLYVPNGTKASLDKLTVAIVRGRYQVHELWRKISNPKASDAGWNVPFTKICIENAYPPDPSSTSTRFDYEEIQQRMKDNDVAEGMDASQIPVFHVFIAEFDGTVSHLIVAETMMPSESGKTEPIQFIFEDRGKRKSFYQVLSPFFFETLDGSWNGIEGLAQSIYDAMELKNRLKCTTIDGAFLRSGISLRAMDAAALDKASLIQIGPFNIIPPGFEVQQSTIMGDLDSTMAADRLIDQTINSNTGIYKPKMDRPEGNPRTAEEVRLTFQAGATLSSSAVNRFYSSLDKFYTEQVRRLVQDPEFKKRCKERGIPEEALKKIRCVKAHRAVGNGSPFMRQQAMQRIAPLVSLMPEKGRLNWGFDTCASETNQYTAKRYFPNEETNTVDRDGYDAHSEENDVPTGGQPMIADFQNHVIHAQSHMVFAASSLASLQQGGDPVKVMAALDIIGPHIVQHLGKIENDHYHAKEHKVLTEQFKQITAQADQLRATIKQQQQKAQEASQQQQEAQSIEQGADPKTQIDMAKAKNDMAIKNAKAQQQMKLKEESHRQKIALADAGKASEISLSQAKHQNDTALAVARAADEQGEE